MRVLLTASPPARRVAVLDVLGRKCRVLPRPAADNCLPLTGLPAGVYLVRAKTSAGTLTQRLLVE